jgi:hypothetical protein
MFKKIILYIVASIAIFIFLMSGHPKFLRGFNDIVIGNNEKWYGTVGDRYGDLFRLSNLTDFKIQTEKFSKNVVKVADTTKEVDLWILGDSFLINFDPAMGDSILYKTNLKYYFFPLAEVKPTKIISLKSNKKKVLLIERSERFLRFDFNTRKSIEKYLHYYTIDSNTSQEEAYIKNTSTKIEDIKKPFLSEAKDLFTFKFRGASNTEQNLELMLFGYNLFLPIKEWKANTNYKLFNRVNRMAYVSPDKKNLYFEDTVNPDFYLSSFKTVSKEEIDSIVSCINYLADGYKKQGFDEVVFSFIPSAVTIEDPGLGVYNDIINKVQYNENLHFPVVDIYNVFKKNTAPKTLYRPSDTHWNENGFKLWIETLNGFLKKTAEAK